MRSLPRLTLAAAVLATAGLSAACGTSPLEPAAAAPTAPVNSGYTVSWGAKDQPAPTGRVNSGYTVSWGRQDQSAPTDRVNSGYTVSWGFTGQPPAQP